MCDPSPLTNISPVVPVFNGSYGMLSEEDGMPWDQENVTIQGHDQGTQTYNGLRNVVNSIILPVVFSFGILGNILSLLIFCKKSHRRGRDHVERSATAGLIALALSDLLFCVAGLPEVVLSRYATGTGTGVLVVVAFYYMTNRGALGNIFLFSSTWLIVLISLERYLAICWPFRGRMWIKVRRTVILHSSVFLVAVIVNIPLFFKYNVHQVSCYGGCLCYTWQPGLYFQYASVAQAHGVFWSVIGTFIPLIALIFSNVHLVKEIYRAKSATMYDEQDRRASNRTTVTLLAVVLLFLFLVCPSMILEFLQTHFYAGSANDNIVDFRIAILLTNLTQAIKFACNFLLYCAVNKQFRRHVRSSKCSQSGSMSQRASVSSNRYHMVELRT